MQVGGIAKLVGGLAIGALALGVATPALADAFQKGPYLQNVSETSVTVMWESGRPTDCAIVVLDADARRSVPSGPLEIHEVVLDRLVPGSRYRYAVRCGDDTAEGEFATAPTAEASYSFVVFGDSRSNSSSHAGVVDRVRREVPDFMLGTGDMVDDGAKEVEWQAFFDIERELLRENVLFPSVGNHDRQGRGRTTDNYRKYFSLPENSPDPERYYAFTYGNARFLILDSNAYSFSLTDQTAWIEQQLQAARQDPRIRHIFVTMHHPPYSVSLHGGQRELRERWTPLYEKYGVAAVFSGHDHVYSRADKNGVRYFVTGGGGAPLYPKGRQPSALDLNATRYFERVNHYLRVNVVGDFIEITAVRADGTLIESVNWGTRPPPPVRVAAVGAGDRAVGAAEAGSQEPARIDAAPLAADGRGGAFGWFGKLGAAIMVLASVVLIRTLRS